MKHYTLPKNTTLKEWVELNLNEYLKVKNPEPTSAFGKFWDRATDWLYKSKFDREQALALKTQLANFKNDSDILNSVEATRLKLNKNSTLHWLLKVVVINDPRPLTFKEMIKCGLDSYFKKDNPAPTSKFGKFWESATTWITGRRTERQRAKWLNEKIAGINDEIKLKTIVARFKNTTSQDSLLRWRLLKHLSNYYQLKEENNYKDQVYKISQSSTAYVFALASAAATQYGGGAFVYGYDQARNRNLEQAVIKPLVKDLGKRYKPEDKIYVNQFRNNQESDHSTSNAKPSSSLGRRR